MRNSRAFSLQVQAPPLSETIVPNCGFASTFVHGVGAACPCAVVMTYSRPSGVNPPSPLKNIRSRRGRAADGGASVRRIRVDVRAGTGTSTGLRPLIWSASDPRLSLMMARATVWSRMRSSFDICSAGLTKIPPGRSATLASVPAAISPMICSWSPCR